MAAAALAFSMILQLPLIVTTMTWRSKKTGPRFSLILFHLVYMSGSTVDFVDDLIGQSFKVQNPLAKASCGCGTSFTI